MAAQPFVEIGPNGGKDITEFLKFLVAHEWSIIIWLVILAAVAYLHFCWVRMTPKEKSEFKKGYMRDKDANRYIRDEEE